MQKQALALILALSGTLLLASCGKPDLHHDERLDGKWLSHPIRTLPGIMGNRDMSKEEKGNALKKLGQLAFVFRGNTTAVTFEKKPDERLEQQIYTVTERTPDSVTIQTSKGAVAKYYFEGDCFYLINPEWKYRDYFCKVPEFR